MKDTKDILVLFEQLSNYEVFTPPRVANDMLNLIPQEVFTNPDYKFLDPCVKSGVFLREIFFRLMDGLPKDKSVKEYKASDGLIYDLTVGKQRASHIFKNMLYGIAISELTGYVSRRTLYGVMRANTDKQEVGLTEKMKAKLTDKQISSFIDQNIFNDFYNHKIFQTEEYKGCEEEGNIFYPTQEVLDLISQGEDLEIEEKYIPFIRKTQHRKILDIKENKMRFDVIIGNPPYQENTSGHGAQAKPIYQKFIQNAISYNPNYICFITPSRWMFGGMGLSDFRQQMMHKTKIEYLRDFPDSKECFLGVEIKGGVSYFVWNANKEHGDEFVYSLGEKCQERKFLNRDGEYIFFRDLYGESILNKIQFKHVGRLTGLGGASSIPTNFNDLTRDRKSEKDILIYGRKTKFGFDGRGFVSPEKIKFSDTELLAINKYKVIAPKASGNGQDSRVLSPPMIIGKGEYHSFTYYRIICFETEVEAHNFLLYYKTKFFRYLVSLVKTTQDALGRVYKFIPDLPMNKIWTDKELYEYFELTKEEIDHIESSIAPME